MRKHGSTPFQRDKHVTLAAISRPGVARGRFVGGQQSGLAGCKSPPLFKCRATSCSSQRQRQREPWGASPRPTAPTYLPTYDVAGYHLMQALFPPEIHEQLQNIVKPDRQTLEEWPVHGAGYPGV